MTSGDTGIGLDENFDLVIDNSGDVGSLSDIEEMHKDLAGQLTLLVEDELVGAVLTNNRIAETKAGIQSVLDDDDRVTDIVNVSVRKNRVGNLARVEITVDSIYGGLQFNVSGSD